MNISIEELRAITGAGECKTGPAGDQPTGQNIVVLDRGFVYVGECRRVGDIIEIKNARNIRVWGTTDGLGELRNGPLPTTKLDTVGDIGAPWRAVIHWIKCKGF